MWAFIIELKISDILRVNLKILKWEIWEDSWNYEGSSDDCTVFCCNIREWQSDGDRWKTRKISLVTGREGGDRRCVCMFQCVSAWFTVQTTPVWRLRAFHAWNMNSPCFEATALWDREGRRAALCICLCGHAAVLQQTLVSNTIAQASAVSH